MSTIESICALLPQMQCGLCGYSGCKPYAEAIAHQKASIALCAPGGLSVLYALAEHMQCNATAFEETVRQRETLPRFASIRESECIGCTKCMQVCPTDAIVGSHKMMHTVLHDACTGCGLCFSACPVDCIDSDTTKTPPVPAKEQWRVRHEQRSARLARANTIDPEQPIIPEPDQRRRFIFEAIERVRKKKNTHSTHL